MAALVDAPRRRCTGTRGLRMAQVGPFAVAGLTGLVVAELVGTGNWQALSSVGALVATTALVARREPPARPSAPTGLVVTDPFFDELARSRRYDHRFCLVRVRAGALADPAGELRPWLRSTDHWWTTADDVHILLPETDREAGHRWVSRLRDGAGSPLTTADVRLVAFPDDGLTSSALLAALSRPAGPAIGAVAGPAAWRPTAEHQRVSATRA